MKLPKLILLVLALALVGVPAPAQVQPDQLRVLIAEIGPIQRLDVEMTQVLIRLTGGSAAFDEFAIGQTTLDEAIARSNRSVSGAAAEIAGFEARATAIGISPVGDTELDAMLAEVVSFVRQTPALLKQMLVAVEAQISAAEAGDMDTVFRISSEMGGLAVVQVDRESAMMTLQLATIDRRHPQHGLTAAWLATNDGMRQLAVLGVAAEDEVPELLAAIPGNMREAAGRMRSEIGRTREAIAAMRVRVGGASWIAEVLGMRSSADRELLTDVLDEFEQALDVETRLADLLDHGAGLVTRLGEGDIGDEVMAGLVAFDEAYLAYIQERQAEAQDRLRVLQEWQSQ